jgi:hypothetical protein
MELSCRIRVGVARACGQIHRSAPPLEEASPCTCATAEERELEASLTVEMRGRWLRETMRVGCGSQVGWSRMRRTLTDVLIYSRDSGLRDGPVVLHIY